MQAQEDSQSTQPEKVASTNKASPAPTDASASLKERDENVSLIPATQVDQYDRNFERDHSVISLYLIRWAPCESAEAAETSDQWIYDRSFDAELALGFAISYKSNTSPSCCDLRELALTLHAEALSQTGQWDVFGPTAADKALRGQAFAHSREEVETNLETLRGSLRKIVEGLPSFEAAQERGATVEIHSVDQLRALQRSLNSKEWHHLGQEHIPTSEHVPKLPRDVTDSEGEGSAESSHGDWETEDESGRQDPVSGNGASSVGAR